MQKALGEPIYLITSNGARIHNKAGEVILKRNLPATIAQEIANLEFDASVQINLFTDDHWYANFKIPELDDIALGKDFTCEVTDIKWQIQL